MSRKLKNDGWISLDEESQLHKSTHAYTKMTGYFENKILKQDFFQSEIARLRNEFDVEVVTDDNEWDFLVDESIYDTPLDEKIAKLCKRYSLDELDFVPIIRNYIYHNEIKYSFHPNSALCYVEDGSKSDKVSTENDEKICTYPVTIRISPYANKPDILDFVEKVYSTQIEPLQRPHVKKDVTVGEYRQTNPVIRKMYDFIFEHRTLPLREIYKLIDDEFGESPDEGHLGKIISLEKIRRKQL